MNKKILPHFVVRLPVRSDSGQVVGTREFVTYIGLLAMAHDEGLSSLETTLVQVPSDTNGRLAIVHAVAVGKPGRFTGLGDACPENVGRKVARHSLRIAETRAKARALRDFTNVGMVAVEELSSDELDGSEAAAGVGPQAAPSDRPTPAPELATEAQRRALGRRAQELGHGGPALERFLAKRFGGELGRMTKEQASRLIAELDAELRDGQVDGKHAAE